MLKKNSVLSCLLLSTIFVVTATLVYPGGSLFDRNSVGFDWTRNFISNLFGAKALNGAVNPARPWAIIGMAFHSIGYGLFFFNMSGKIPVKSAILILKTIAVVNILFSFLIVTSLHDIMVTVASTLSLVGLFYIIVFLLRTKHHVLKIISILCLLAFYYTLFLYGSGNWRLLAIMQKISIVSSMLLVIVLDYVTKPGDFTQLKRRNKQIETETVS